MDTDDVLGQSRADITMPGRSLFRRVVATDERVLWCITRIALAAVIASHGVPIAILIAVLLFSGTLVRAAALASIAFLYLGAASTVFDVLAIPAAVVAIIGGAGPVSIDRFFMHRRPMPGGSVDDRFVNP